MQGDSSHFNNCPCNPPLVSELISQNSFSYLLSLSPVTPTAFNRFVSLFVFIAAESAETAGNDAPW